MKIIYLLDDTLDKTDGVQQCVITLGEYFRKQGHEVHYFVAETKRNDLDNIHSLVRYVSLRFNGNSVRTPLLASAKEIEQLIADISPDVVHVQMPFSPFFSSRVLRRLKDSVCIVGTWHTFPTGRMQRLSHKILAAIIHKPLQLVSPTIGVSKATAEFADSIYKTHSIVVPNAVDITRFARATSLRHIHDIVFLGRFDSRKGPMHLLKALVELRAVDAKSRRLSVVMGGSGPDLDLCKSYASDNSLNVEFPGFIPEDEKPSLLASSRITIFPSTGGEAFGISIVEAMASGASVVLAGDNPGYRSILGDKPELLFDPLDSRAFAAKVIHYLDLSDKESHIKKQWLKDKATEYDVTRVATQLMDIYTA